MMKYGNMKLLLKHGPLFVCCSTGGGIVAEDGKVVRTVYRNSRFPDISAFHPEFLKGTFTGRTHKLR